MNNRINFKAGDIIIREGTADQTMYEIIYGAVGVFKNYGLPTQVKLAELREEYFGEMELYSDDATRTVTAVALEDTEVEIITKDTLEEYIKNNLFKIDALLQTMSKRIDRMDKRLMDAYGYIDLYKKECSIGGEASEKLIADMKEYCARA